MMQGHLNQRRAYVRLVGSSAQDILQTTVLAAPGKSQSVSHSFFRKTYTLPPRYQRDNVEEPVLRTKRLQNSDMQPFSLLDFVFPNFDIIGSIIHAVKSKTTPLLPQAASDPNITAPIPPDAVQFCTSFTKHMVDGFTAAKSKQAQYQALLDALIGISFALYVQFGLRLVFSALVAFALGLAPGGTAALGAELFQRSLNVLSCSAEPDHSALAHSITSARVLAKLSQQDRSSLQQRAVAHAMQLSTTYGFAISSDSPAAPLLHAVPGLQALAAPLPVVSPETAEQRAQASVAAQLRGNAQQQTAKLTAHVEAATGTVRYLQLDMCDATKVAGKQKTASAINFANQLGAEYKLKQTMVRKLEQALLWGMNKEQIDATRTALETVQAMLLAARKEADELDDTQPGVQDLRKLIQERTEEFERHMAAVNRDEQALKPIGQAEQILNDLDTNDSEVADDAKKVKKVMEEAAAQVKSILEAKLEEVAKTMTKMADESRTTSEHIEKLHKKHSDLEAQMFKKLKEHQANIEELTSQVQEIRKQVEQLNGKVTSVEGDVVQNTKRIEELEEKAAESVTTTQLQDYFASAVASDAFKKILKEQLADGLSQLRHEMGKGPAAAQITQQQVVALIDSKVKQLTTTTSRAPRAAAAKVSQPAIALSDSADLRRLAQQIADVQNTCEQYACTVGCLMEDINEAKKREQDVQDELTATRSRLSSAEHIIKQYTGAVDALHMNLALSG